LVQPITTAITLPTDNHVMPTRNDVMLNGTAEGKPSQAQPGAVVPGQR
jgi:hypothetical protein